MCPRHDPYSTLLITGSHWKASLQSKTCCLPISKYLIHTLPPISADLMWSSGVTLPKAFLLFRYVYHLYNYVISVVKFIVENSNNFANGERLCLKS